MQTNFKLDGNITLKKIETLQIPKGIRTFAVSNCSSVNLELSILGGEIVDVTINLLPNIICNNPKIQCVSISKDTLYLVENISVKLPSTNPLGKLEIDEVTHKFTLIDDGNPKILIESGDKFYACDAMKKQFIGFSAVQNLIALKFDSEIQFVKFDVDYSLVYMGKFSLLTENNGIFNLTTQTETQEGYEITKAVTLKNGVVNEQTTNFLTLRKNNYNKTTFPIVFFERLKYLSDVEILSMMTNSFELSDIPKLKSYIGNFSGVTLISNACILEYNGNFRSFILKLKNELVDNIVEI